MQAPVESQPVAPHSGAVPHAFSQQLLPQMPEAQAALDAHGAPAAARLGPPVVPVVTRAPETHPAANRATPVQNTQTQDPLQPWRSPPSMPH